MKNFFENEKQTKTCPFVTCQGDKKANLVLLYVLVTKCKPFFVMLFIMSNRTSQLLPIAKLFRASVVFLSTMKFICSRNVGSLLG